MEAEQKRKICMFTGHRKIEEERARCLPSELSALIEELIAEGYADFRAGGAVGFDTVAALKVIEKKAKYSHVKLHLFLPCKNQDRSWSETSKAALRLVIKNADSVTYSGEKFSPGCMQKRNREMVEGSDLCVAFFKEEEEGQLDIFGTTQKTKQRGGTAYTVRYARKQGVKVINLY